MNTDFNFNLDGFGIPAPVGNYQLPPIDLYGSQLGTIPDNAYLPTNSADSSGLNFDFEGLSNAFGNTGNLFRGAGSLLGAYIGMKQYGLAKKQFRQNVKEYEQNYAAQRQLTNAQLEDRQRARIASNPNAYVSVSEYLNKHGVK